MQVRGYGGKDLFLNAAFGGGMLIAEAHCLI